MRLSWIEARDFRSHERVRLEVAPGLTTLVGPNGRGKTNLLEAMYYLCSLSSPRVSSDLPLVRQGAASAFLRGEAETSTGGLLVEVEVRASGQNRVQVNRSAIRRKRDLRRQLRAVFSGPDDLALVLGDPSERRRFMDECVVALWPVRDGAASAYERALRQRNRLLKDWPGAGEPAGLAGWDAELITSGAALTALRGAAVESVRARAAAEFRALTGEEAAPLSVEYAPSVRADGGGLEDAFADLLAARREDELIRRTSLVGPHRDDLALTVQPLAARSFASHGEAWGAAAALRLALAAAVSDEVGEDPVLFLDDPFSALDPERRDRLTGSLGGRGQVLVAVPDPAQVPAGASVWRVDREGVRRG